MRKTLILLPTITLAIVITLFLGSSSFAQDSAFSNLADEKNLNREFLSPRGLKRADYLSSRGEYTDLRSEHDQSFGTRKTELAAQMLGRAKDVLTAKLGATSTYLENLYSRVAETGRASEATLAALNKVKNDFVALASGFETKIEEAETLADLRAVSIEINTAIQAAINGSRQALTTLTVARGESMIERIEERAVVVLEHINASADRGGDVEGVQETYNAAMLSLEAAKETYAAINADTTSTPDSLKARLQQANQNLRSAYEGLSSVLEDLKVLYSQSPWQIDRSKFER